MTGKAARRGQPSKSAPPAERSTPGPVTEQIRAAMAAQGIGVTELARRLGRDHAHVSRTLGGTWAPSAEFLQGCADVLGVELVVPEVRYRPEGAA